MLCYILQVTWPILFGISIASGVQSQNMRFFVRLATEVLYSYSNSVLLLNVHVNYTAAYHWFVAMVLLRMCSMSDNMEANK